MVPLSCQPMCQILVQVLKSWARSQFMLNVHSYTNSVGREGVGGSYKNFICKNKNITSESTFWAQEGALMLRRGGVGKNTKHISQKKIRKVWTKEVRDASKYKTGIQKTWLEMLVGDRSWSTLNGGQWSTIFVLEMTFNIGEIEVDDFYCIILPGFSLALH